jgi:hypothetical protein
MNRKAGNPKMRADWRFKSQVFIATYFAVSILTLNPTRIAAAEQATEAEIPVMAEQSGTTNQRQTPVGLTAPSKVQRYAERVITQHDSNGDGLLQPSEWQAMPGTPQTIDLDRDGAITVTEYAAHVVRFSARRRIRLLLPEPPATPDELPLLQPKSAPPVASPAKPAPAATTASAASPSGTDTPSATGTPATPAPAADASRPANRRRDLKFFIPANRLPAGLPSWFHAQDKDGDGQITLAEYSASLTASSLAEFNRYDRNRDGVITSDELGGRGGRAANRSGAAAPK